MKTDDPYRLAFANRLRMLRLINNMPRKELARLVGVPYGRITAWELGYAEAHYEYLIRIADIFEVTVDYLLGYPERSMDYVYYMSL